MKSSMYSLLIVILILLTLAGLSNLKRIEKLEARINQQYKLLCVLDKPLPHVNNAVYKCIGN